MFTVSNAMDQLFTWLYYRSLQGLTNLESYMGYMGTEVFDNTYAKALIQFFYLLGLGLMLVGCIVACAEFAIDYQSGGGSIKDTGINILKGFAAANLFTTVPVQLFALSVHLQTIVATIFNQAGLTTDLTDIVSSGAAASKTTTPMEKLLSIPLDIFNTMMSTCPLLSVVGSLTGASGDSSQQHVPTFAVIFFWLAFLIAFVKILFDNLKRGGILLVQVCVCSLYMFSIPRGYTDGFFSWCKQVAGLCFTTFLQNMFLIIGLGALKSSLIFGVGILLAGAEIPRIAQQFGLESGIKGNMTSVSMTVSSFVNMGRTLAAA